MGGKSKRAQWLDGCGRKPMVRCQRCGKMVSTAETLTYRSGYFMGVRRICRSHGKPTSGPSEKALAQKKRRGKS